MFSAREMSDESVLSWKPSHHDEVLSLDGEAL
jgi:hypothetical protein